LKYKRGYPVAILISLEKDKAVIWKIFSKVAKPENTISINGTRNTPRALYSFHETLINALRPTLKEGVYSVILVSQPRTNHAQEFINHVRDHHTWLTQSPNKTVFSTITGSASSPSQVAILTRTSEFHKLIAETTAEETENLLEILEKRINTADQNSAISFSIEEAENLVLKRQNPNRPKPEYLLLTDKYLKSSRQKSRLHRLMQIAKNKRVKTRVINADSPAGKRLTQLGGIVCLTRGDQTSYK
jgi:stalled ribosome rescue protein Dom34